MTTARISRVESSSALATATATPTVSGGGMLWHYHVDHLGSAQVITNHAGDVLQHVRYTAYGTPKRFDAAGVEVTGQERFRYEFTGYETELQSELQYAGARFYDPELGEFLTHDPARQFASPYTYTNGDPVNLTDPNGEFPWVPVIILAVAAAAAIDTGIRTGDVGAAFGAFALTATVAAAGATVTTAGLGIISASASSATYANTLTALKVAGVAGGAYGTYQAANNGYYATAAVAAALTAFGIYNLTQGAAQGAQGPSWGDAMEGWLRESSGTNPLAGALADSRGGIVINDASGQSDFDRFMDFVRRQGVERQEGAPFIDERIAGSWEQIPGDVRNYEPADWWGRIWDDIGMHYNNQRLPGGYHIETPYAGGPVSVHQDVFDPTTGARNLYLHTTREVIPRIPHRPVDLYADWRP